MPQWWRHQMETFSMLLALCAGNLPVNGEFPWQRSVMRSFDVFFDLCLNKWSSKPSWDWWFEMPSCSLWCHCNGCSRWKCRTAWQKGNDAWARGRGRTAQPLGTALPLWQRCYRRISTVLPRVNTLESMDLPDTPRRSIPVERWISIDRTLIVCL